MTAWVLGFDLSLTAPAAVALPINWRPRDWRTVRSFGFNPKAPKGDDYPGHMARYDEIARWACAVAEEVQQVARPDKVRVWVEGYGFSKNNAQSSKVMESGGVVRLRLWQTCKLAVTVVTSSQARKLFLGALPSRRKGDPPLPKGAQKLAVQDVLFNKCGAPKNWTEDQADALVVANWGLSELGGTCIALPPPEKPTKARRR